MTEALSFTFPECPLERGNVLVKSLRVSSQELSHIFDGFQGKGFWRCWRLFWKTEGQADWRFHCFLTEEAPHPLPCVLRVWGPVFQGEGDDDLISRYCPRGAQLWDNPGSREPGPPETLFWEKTWTIWDSGHDLWGSVEALIPDNKNLRVHLAHCCLNFLEQRKIIY